jgi:hypothetical protein
MESGKSQTKQSQIRAFRKAARELGCEDNEDRFKAALRTVGKAKPSDKGEKRRPHR